ncbi:hypothetical protein NDU88_011595 [Pleurodeles waltl]|uniref:Uncharacterized protein n=1 Tax=Pleurodeles waltl TaxID=8319 RepID=A0AAV7QY34_PLEWA|nr:hypothetical protein NDU88_011595 [Pleurodeles waltl]
MSNSQTPASEWPEEMVTMPSSMHLNLDKILPAIVDTKTALQQEISRVSVGLGLLRAEHQKLADRVHKVKRGYEEICPAQKDLGCQCTSLTDRVRVLER